MKNIVYIDFNSNGINIYYDNDGVGQSERVPINELMDILIETAKEHNYKDANQFVTFLTKEGLIRIDDSALDQFNNVVIPVVQNAIAPIESKDEDISLMDDSPNDEDISLMDLVGNDIEKVYIHANKKEGTYYIKYTDGTIKEKSRDDAIQEFANYMKKNNLSTEQAAELGIVEEIDEEQVKTLLEQQSSNTSQEPADENTFNIEKIYTYWKTNSEDPEKEEELRGIVCYKDGTKKDKGKKELRQDILDCMEKYSVKSIKGLEDLGVLEEISEEKVNSILEKTPEIGKIVFFSYITDKKEIETRAMIYYTDGRIKEVSRAEAEKEILNIKMANNIKKTEQLFKENFIECITISELKNNHSIYMEQAEKNKGKYASATPGQRKKKKAKKKKDNIFKRIWKKLKENKLVRRITIGIAALSVLGGVATYKLVHKSPIEDINPENTQEDEINDNIINITPDNATREDFSVYSYDELIQRCKTNKGRQEAVQTIYSFITDYNLTTSYLYKEEKSPEKLSHTVDEVSAMYLLYNNINPEKVNEIYQGTPFDTTNLRNDLINAQKQDSLAHNIQTKTINKDKLFTDSTAKKFYNKYEEIFIKMNDTSNFDEKAEYKKTFNDMVRSDLSGMASNSYENVDCSKIVIKEFADAMQRVKIDVDNELTDQEIKYIDGILENVIDKKIKDIVIKQTARNQEATMEYDEGKMIDPNPYYTEFKEAITKELEAKDSYYTTDNDRDITDYKKFKENIEPKQYDKKEAETAKEQKTEKTNNQSTSTSTNTTPTTPPVETTPPQPSQPEEPEEPVLVEAYIEEEAHMMRESRQIDVLEEMYDEIEDSERIPIDIPDRVPDDNINPDNELEFVDISRPKPGEEPVFPPINQGIEEITIDDVNNENEQEELIPDGMEESEIQIVSPDEATVEHETSSENIIEIDPDKTDKAGNLSDQYTDVSTDLTSATTYQTNNSEELADFIINQMEQQAESYVEETSHVK